MVDIQSIPLTVCQWSIPASMAVDFFSFKSLSCATYLMLICQHTIEMVNIRSIPANMAVDSIY